MSESKAPVEELNFEDSLRRLEVVVGKLESGDAPLEEGLKLFEEGVSLSRRCQELLEQAEKRVSRLVRDDRGELDLTLFAAGDEES